MGSQSTLDQTTGRVDRLIPPKFMGSEGSFYREVSGGFNVVLCSEFDYARVQQADFYRVIGDQIVTHRTDDERLSCLGGSQKIRSY